MRDLPEAKRDFQADVHFTLGAVIQGVTVAALGNELAVALRALPFPGAFWVFATGVQSLLLCIIFWYSFMHNYQFGFRVINLNAKTHFAFAAFYLILGLQQVIAIQFLDVPRIWLTLYVLMIASAFAGTWLSSHVPVIDDNEVQEAMQYDPYARFFPASFTLSVACVIVWYVFPGVDTPLFRAVALSISGAGLVVFAVYYILVFQKALELK
jgi:hypothetical protein